VANLKVKMGTMELNNPVIISAGHLTRTGKEIENCDRFGAGAIITKSSFLGKDYEKVVNPYAPGLFPDARAKFHSTGDGYLAACGLSPWPVETWAQWFRENIYKIKTPVIASIMAVSTEGYVKSAKMLQEAGAPAIEILLACPLPYLLPHPYVGGASFNPVIVEEVCLSVRKAVNIPVGVKLMFNPLDTSPLKIPLEVGLDWITVCMAILAAPGINLETIEPDIPTSVFLCGSKAAKHANFVALLALAEQYKDIHISASGGTQKWSDIIEYIMYGANTVQIQGLFLEKGLGIIDEIKKEILAYMDTKGYSSIDNMKGAIFEKLISFDEALSTYSETRDQINVSVDRDKCVACGLCEGLCNWNALALVGGKLETTKECEGCGLCVCSCPEDALTLENVETIRQAARG